jgi:hypothetical protein
MSEQEQTPPSKEELEQRSKELTAFYKKELPLLRLRSEYEELITKIEVAKMQRLEIMIARAEIMQGPEGQAPEESNAQQENVEHVRPVNDEKTTKTVKQGKPTTKNRKLKKVK